MAEQFEHSDNINTDKTWDEISASASERKKLSEEAALDEMIEKARASGKEEFDIDKALIYYCPNDIADDETAMEKTIIALAADYYYSDALTIEDWARRREQIKAQGDS